MNKHAWLTVLTVLAVLVAGVVVWRARYTSPDVPPLSVAVSPYQDIAMLTVYKELGLEDKYGTRLSLVTLPWEEIIPTLASAGQTVDVGFGSLIEYLTKYENVNTGNNDPLLFIYPAYVFKGGGFVTFNRDMTDLNVEGTTDPEQIKAFLSYRLGAQKNSLYDMMLYTLMRRAGISRDKVNITDTTMADGLLAAENGALDAVGAGLTQRNEALEKGGRVVLSMDKLGFADITGFMCRQSTLNARRHDIENLIRMWFDSVHYVYEDMGKNAATPLAYLARTSSTQYTVETYRRALEAEYLPTTLEDARDVMLNDKGAFPMQRIAADVGAYLVEMGIARQAPPPLAPITLGEAP